MKKADISFFALIFFLTRAMFNLVESPKVAWMVSLFLFIILFLFLISKTKRKFPIILSLIYIFLGIFIIDNMTIFISTNYFNDINKYIIKLPLLIVISIVVYKGFDSIKSTSEILFFMFIVVFFIVIINSCFYINPYNLVDFVSDVSVNIDFTNFLPLFIIPVFYGLKEDYIDTRSIIFYFIVSFLTIMIEVIVVGGVVGDKMMNVYLYPTTRLLRKLPYFSFSNRLDYLNSLVFLFESTVSLSYLLERIKKEKTILFCFALIILFLF